MIRDKSDVDLFMNNEHLIPTLMSKLILCCVNSQIWKRFEIINKYDLYLKQL